MNVALHKPMTRDEFLFWVERQDRRYEFDGTQPVAMVGGTNNHALITGNLYFQVKLRLGAGPCVPMLPEGGGVATIGSRVRCPEVTVTCSKVPGKEHLIPDPVIVFEVISPSSVRIDQVLKLREYHAVPSIKRYVLIEQDGIGLIVHARQAGEPWVTAPLVAGDTLALPEIGIEFPVATLYDGITFDDAGTR